MNSAFDTYDHLAPLGKQKTLHTYGMAVGHHVVLVRVRSSEGVGSLHVAIGIDDGASAKSVALLPDTADGEREAATIASAILSSLEVVNKTLIDRFIETLD